MVLLVLLPLLEKKSISVAIWPMMAPHPSIIPYRFNCLALLKLIAICLLASVDTAFQRKSYSINKQFKDLSWRKILCNTRNTLPYLFFNEMAGEPQQTQEASGSQVGIHRHAGRGAGNQRHWFNEPREAALIASGLPRECQIVSSAFDDIHCRHFFPLKSFWKPNLLLKKYFVILKILNYPEAN